MFRRICYGRIERQGTIEEDSDQFKSLLEGKIWDISGAILNNFPSGSIRSPDLVVEETNLSDERVIMFILGQVNNRQLKNYKLEDLPLGYEQRFNGRKTIIIDDKINTFARYPEDYSGSSYYLIIREVPTKRQ